MLCVGQSATDTDDDANKRRAKRSTKRVELFKHPIFVSQRKNLDVEEEANCMTMTSIVVMGDMSKDSRSAKHASTDRHNDLSLPVIIQDRVPSAVAETNNDPPSHHVLTINIENGLGKCKQSQNVALRNAKAVSCLEPIMQGPAIKNSHSTFSLTTNNAYGSSSRPNSVYNQEELLTSNVHHEVPLSLEENPSYLQLPSDLSDPSDEQYSYVSTFNHALIGKNSTWPQQTQQHGSSTASDVEAVGIYVDLDYTDVSKKQITEEENYYI